MLCAAAQGQSVDVDAMKSHRHGERRESEIMHRARARLLHHRLASFAKVGALNSGSDDRALLVSLAVSAK
jgi:hypothetical protein